MKSRSRPLLALAVLIAGPGLAQAQQGAYDSPTLLPLPQLSPQVASRQHVPAQQHPVYNPPVYQGAWAGYTRTPEQVPGAPRMADPYHEAAGAGWGDVCALPTACGPQWFGGVYGLLMTRDRPNKLSFSADSDTYDCVLDNRSTSMGWQGGIETRLGRTFGCGQYGWEVVYWGIFSNMHEANVHSADLQGDLITPLTLDNLEVNGENVGDCVDGALRHRLRSTYEFHNVELNLLRLPLGSACGACGTCGPRFTCGGTFGVRFLRINEGFEFASDHEDGMFGTTPEHEIFYNVDLRNNLIGVQLGCMAQYHWTCRLSMFSDLKFGIYGNHITQHSAVMAGDGNIAVINNGPNDGEEYWINSHKNDVAFLGELRLGANYQMTQNWRAVAAYRAVALTGVALPSNQVPVNFGDLLGASNIDSNGSMILHGVQLGVEFTY